MAPVARDNSEYIGLEVSHKISNITLALYLEDEEANKLVVLNTVKDAFNSPLVTIPNVVDLSAASNSGRRNLLSAASSIQVSYKIQSSTQSIEVDSAEAETSLETTIKRSVDDGEFQMALRYYADSLGAPHMLYAISSAEGFSVRRDSSGDEVEDTFMGYDEKTALTIFAVTIAILLGVLCAASGRALCCPKGKGNETMSLADQARRNAQNFDVNGDDLEMTWVQTDRGSCAQRGVRGTSYTLH